MILVPAVFDEVASIVCAEDFYADPHRKIFRQIDQIRKEGLPVDENLLAERLRAAGEWESVGKEVIFECCDSVGSPATAPELARQVREKSTRRALIRAATELLKSAYDPYSEATDLQHKINLVAHTGDRPGGLSRRQIKVISSAEFDAAEYQMEYLVEKVAVVRQNTIVGGVGKVLKTLITGCDMGISIASGTPFLGKFAIPKKRRVAFLSGESGEFKLQDAARRICYSKGISLSDCDMQWGWDLPQLTKDDDLAALGRMLKETKVEVLMIDPLYLCLLGGGDTRQASNLFDMGSVLYPLTAMAREHNLTLVLMHHCVKHSSDLSKPPDLKDISFAGFSEWARQWLLLSRRAEYDDGTGHHELWLRAGGSAGHGGVWAVDVDEGQVDDHLRGEKWEVSVMSGAAAKEEANKAKAAKASDKAQRLIDENVEKLRKAMRANTGGLTERQMQTSTGLRAKTFTTARDVLAQRGEIEECQVKNGGGKFSGWRPTDAMKGLDDNRPLLPEGPVDDPESPDFEDPF